MNNFSDKVSFIWSMADLLREPCRPKLTAAAVTGKIDVRKEIA